MQPQRIGDIPCEVLYYKKTKKFRVLEMILCLICLIAVSFLLFTIDGLVVLLMVLFATALAFFIITFIDVLAGCKNKQYTTPAWIAIAVVATVLFCLCFGLMIPHSKLLLMIIGILFLVTGIVFLIDGIFILRKLLKAYDPQKVHPYPLEHEPSRVSIRSEKPEEEPLSEVPLEMRVSRFSYSPPKRQPQICKCPMTSYGGTFPVGERDAPPLPTPDNLTGMDRTSQSIVMRRSTRELPSGVRSSFAGLGYRSSTGSPEMRRQSYDQEMRRQTYDQEMRRQTYDQEMRRQTYDGNEYSTTIQEEVPIVDLPYDPSMVYPEECLKKDDPTPYNPDMIVQLDDTQGGRNDPCKCCCGRRKTLAESRDQVTPFVTHHYNQSPCICGYTHYQSSTVIKGAVKQAPQESLEDQQRMIQDQLDQIKGSYSKQHYVCDCNEKPRRPSGVNKLSCPCHRRNSLDDQFILDEYEFKGNSEKYSNRTMYHYPIYSDAEDNNVDSLRVSCKRIRECKCICGMPTEEDEDTQSVHSEHKKLTVSSLTEKSYHPKDDFVLPPRPMRLSDDTGRVSHADVETMKKSVSHYPTLPVEDEFRNTASVSESREEHPVYFEDPPLKPSVGASSFRRSLGKKSLFECVPDCVKISKRQRASTNIFLDERLSHALEDLDQEDVDRKIEEDRRSTHIAFDRPRANSSSIRRSTVAKSVLECSLFDCPNRQERLTSTGKVSVDERRFSSARGSFPNQDSYGRRKTTMVPAIDRSLTQTRSEEYLAPCPCGEEPPEVSRPRKSTMRRSDGSYLNYGAGSSVSKRGTLKRMHPDFE